MLEVFYNKLTANGADDKIQDIAEKSESQVQSFILLWDSNGLSPNLSIFISVYLFESIMPTKQTSIKIYLLIVYLNSITSINASTGSSTDIQFKRWHVMTSSLKGDEKGKVERKPPKKRRDIPKIDMHTYRTISFLGVSFPSSLFISSLELRHYMSLYKALSIFVSIYVCVKASSGGTPDTSQPPTASGSVIDIPSATMSSKQDFSWISFRPIRF